MAMLACLPAYLLARSEMLWPASTGGSESGSSQILCRIAPAWEAGVDVGVINAGFGVFLLLELLLSQLFLRGAILGAIPTGHC